MKQWLWISSVVVLLLSGCGKTQRNEVVAESFIHKFGVPISKSDWSLNGHDGQIVQLLTNGVTMTRTYVKGVLQGETTYTFPNSSTIATVEIFDQGELVCKTDHYPSGVSKLQECYKSNLLSQVTRWYEDGTPALVEEYEGGFLRFGEYRTPLNVVEARVEEGIGTRLMRGAAGEIAVRDIVRGGQMVERTTYFPSGEPAAITPYENGMVHGMRQTFLPGGVPSAMEGWIHGKQEGTTIVFLNGERIAEVPYVKGEKHGVEYRYRDGETLAEEVTWRHNVQHGQRKILVGGEEIKTEWYHEGELVSRPAFERLNLPNSSR